MPVNYAGEGHLTRLMLTQGTRTAWGARGAVDAGWAAARDAVVFSSLYCPKDNIEEALLLLLISESMVSPRHN